MTHQYGPHSNGGENPKPAPPGSGRVKLQRDVLAALDTQRGAL